MIDIDYYVYTIPLPLTIKGMISVDAEGFYSIYINANISDDEQRAALEHELKHARAGHLFDDSKSAEDCEREVS